MSFLYTPPPPADLRGKQAMTVVLAARRKVRLARLRRDASAAEGGEKRGPHTEWKTARERADVPPAGYAIIR